MSLKANFILDNGIILSEGHLEIISCTISYLNVNAILIIANLYKDLIAFNSGRPEVIQLKYQCNDPIKFQEYFSEEILSQLNVTILSQSYLYLKSFPQFTDY